MKQSVWRRIYLPSAVILVLTAVCLVLGLKYRVSSDAEKAADARAAADAVQYAERLAARTESCFSEMEFFAGQLAEANVDTGGVLAFLQNNLPSDGFRKTAVAGERGIAYCSDGGTEDVYGLEPFERCLKQGGREICGFARSNGASGGRILLFVPVPGEARAVVSFIGEQSLAGVFGYDSPLYLLDGNGAVLYANTDLLPDLSDGELSPFEQDGVKYAAASSPVGSDGWRVVCLAGVSAGDPDILPILVITAVALILLTVLCAIFSSRLKKLEQSRSALEEYCRRASEAMNGSSVALWDYTAATGALTRTPPPLSDGTISGVYDLLPNPKLAVDLLQTRLMEGQRVVDEELEVGKGRLVRFRFRNSFDESGVPCSASGFSQDCTLTKDVRDRIDQQTARFNRLNCDFIVGLQWNLTLDELVQCVGFPSNDDPKLKSSVRIRNALHVSSALPVYLLRPQRLIQRFRESRFNEVIPVTCSASDGGTFSAELELHLLRSPDTYDLFAFMFLRRL